MRLETLSEVIEQYVFEGILFEWNRAKAASNVRKHEVSFGEAATVFGDADGIMIPDPDHSEEDQGFCLLDDRGLGDYWW
jgi:hypothetical protein